MTIKNHKPLSWWSSVYVLLNQGLRVDFSSKDRLITPIFFAAVILLLFTFAIPEPDPTLRSRMMIAESQMAIFFALQIAFSRAFESERLDRVFDHLRLSPLDSSAFITAKIFHVLLIGSGTMLCTGLLSIILQGQDLSIIADPVIIGISSLALFGLTGLGVLLAVVTLRADGHQIIFPLLYFPLSVPVLLCSTESLVLWLDTHQWSATIRGWATLLVAFDVIFITLALLFGSEGMQDGS